MIHLYRFKDENIVLDVNSGAVHVVSDITYDILSFFVKAFGIETDSLFSKENALVQLQTFRKTCLNASLKENQPFKDLCSNYSLTNLEEALSEIEELISEDMLFAEDVSEELTNPENRGAVIKAMCLHIAHDCNMRCAYCFADTGGFEGERSLLSFETGKAALDFLVLQSGNRRNLEVDFFGGEPLMNFEVVKKLVAYGREIEQKYDKNFRFTITTNGLLLDDAKTEFINKNMDNVIISIDGRPEINDLMRKTTSGSGTYDLIIDKLINFVEKRDNLYYVRGTFTAKNKDFANDVKHLVDLGFRNVSVEPVVADSKYDYALTMEDLPILLEEYDRLSEIYLSYNKERKPFSFFHFNIDLTQGPCVYKRAAGCGAGTEYVAIAPSGDIYPCHQFVGNKDFLLGSVGEVNSGKASLNERIIERFNHAHIYNKPSCRDCWAKYYCSGGCHANAYHENGDMLIPYKLGCELEKKRIECAIGILSKI